jgi:hypothetical protein
VIRAIASYRFQLKFYGQSGLIGDIISYSVFLLIMKKGLFKSVWSPNLHIIATFGALLLLLVDSSVTNPLRADGDISKVLSDYDGKASKAYYNSTPHDLKELPIITYNSPDPDCNVGFRLAWSSTVGSPVYSSPVVFPSGTGIVSCELHGMTLVCW